MRPSTLKSTLVRVFIFSIIASVTPILKAQVTPQNTSGFVNPHEQLDRTARMVKSDDYEPTRALADAVFAFPRMLPRAPETIENVIKDRLVLAELAYHRGTQEGIRERDIVKLVNSVTDKLGVPSYAKTSLRQLRVLRMQLALSSPSFMAAGLTTQDMKVGDSISDRMSPLQAVHLINSLVDQKLINPDFQVEPEEWERIHLASEMTKIQQRQQLQAAGQTGGHTLKAEVRVVYRKRDLHEALLKAGDSLGFLDTTNLIDQAFTTLKIGR